MPPDSALFIGPGCFIEFQGYYQFVVDTSALFQASGTESDSIIFTAEDSLIGWDGFHLLGADSGSHINFCVIKNGYARHEDHNYSRGGGINCQNSYLSIQNCTFVADSASGGGAIYIRENHYVRIEDNLFEGNIAYSGGAILSRDNSNVVITGNIFRHNNNTTVIDSYSEPFAMLITGNLFHDNNQSGIISVASQGLRFENNIIRDNICVVVMYFMISGPNYFKRNIIYNNHCPWSIAGGIFISEDSNYLVENNAIVNNTGVNGSYLGWITEEHGTNSPVVFKNNVIWGNEYPEDSLFYVSAPNFSINYCDIQGGWSGSGNIIADPMFVDSANGDFHLMPGSPCIDTGSPFSPLDPDSTRADMGALPFDQTTSIENHLELPTRTKLAQNYPNPFNASTAIEFKLAKVSKVKIAVYDLLGRMVETLVDEEKQAGCHQVVWHASDHSSGLYFYRLQAGDAVEIKRMMLLK